MDGGGGFRGEREQLESGKGGSKARSEGKRVGMGGKE